MGALPNATTTDVPTTDQTCEHGHANCDGVADPLLPCFECAQDCLARYEWCDGLLADPTAGQSKCAACTTRAARFDGSH
jgi:hypothetical protein